MKIKIDTEIEDCNQLKEPGVLIELKIEVTNLLL